MLYKDKNVDLVGIDWSETGLAEAKKNYPQGIYVKAKADDTKIRGSLFDTVVMFGLLDYFDDWTAVVNEAKRLAKPGGDILATLLYGFQDHLWTEELVKTKTNVTMFKHVCGNWYLIKIEN